MKREGRVRRAGRAGRGGGCKRDQKEMKKVVFYPRFAFSCTSSYEQLRAKSGVGEGERGSEKERDMGGERGANRNG